MDEIFSSETNVLFQGEKVFIGYRIAERNDITSSPFAHGHSSMVRVSTISLHGGNSIG